MSAFLERVRAFFFARLRVYKEARLSSSMRTPIVPSYFGLAFFVLLLLLLLWVINYRLNLGYALVFILFFVAVFSSVIGASQLSGLVLRMDTPSAVFAGEEGFFPLVVEEDLGRTRGAFFVRHGGDVVECPALLPNQRKRLLLPVKTLSRGVVKMRPLEVFSLQPLGLFVCWHWRFLEAELVVYPKPFGDLPLPFSASLSAGRASSGLLGEEEFYGLRPYVMGDNLARVAWKQSSRGSLMVKQFSGVGGERVLLDYQLAQGDEEMRLSQLAKWIVEADALGHVYALRLPSLFIDFGYGKRHFHRCLKALAVM